MARSSITARPRSRLAWSCAAMLAATLHGAGALASGEVAATLAGPVGEANLVIVGRVLGTVDTKPDAQARKHLEAHWVRVEQTLMGSDAAGQRFMVRSSGLTWQDGEAYVLALSWVEGNQANAVAQPLAVASEANIAAAREAVAANGGTVEPRRVLWMRHVGGWQVAPTTELIVGADGGFTWTAAAPAGERLSGRFPNDVVAGLIRRVAEAGEGPRVDDTGSVTFRWLDAAGQAQIKRYAVPDAPPATALPGLVETLAREHGSPR